MNGPFAACLASLALLMCNTLARAASPVWISALDNTSQLSNGLIDHRISSEILALPILGLRFYRVDGAGSYVELAPYLGFGSTLQDHFNQPWVPTGYETDNYKFLSVDTGSRVTTIHIADDHDIVNPAGGPFIRQTNYSGTPAGIITSGYTTAFFWLDHGHATYEGGVYGSIVYRMDILTMLPELVAPTVNCSVPLILESTNGAAVAVLQADVQDASGSTVQVVWTVDGTPAQTNTIPSGGNITHSNVTLTANFGLGEHVVVVTASNSGTNVATCSTTVSVRDTTPPQISHTQANPSVLWPPNNKMVPVTISVTASDANQSIGCRIIAVRSNEARVSAMRHSKPEPDWQITGDLTVSLRAQRLGTGQGRVYSIDVECTDAAGNTSMSTVAVTVPKNN